MLSRNDAVLMVVDIQGKLAQLMHGKEALFENVRRMIRGANVLGVPIVWAEQNPKGLGPTVPEIAEIMTGIEPIPKLSFSCCGEDAIASTLQELGRRQVLLAGIEAHVCVYQTAMDLLGMGYGVHVVADAVSSRAKENREIGLQRMRDEGVKLTSVEMALFELLRVAQGDDFKEILRIVK